MHDHPEAMDDLAKLKLPGVFIMAGREQSHTSKPGMDPKPQGDMAGKGGQTHGGQGDLPKEREHGVKSGDAVGRDAEGREVADSKERSTEIAVEAGRKGRGEHPDDKR
jgi:hypothetical protein